MAKEVKEAVKEAVEDQEAVMAAAEGLIAMCKDGVRSFVHATCVVAHEVAGWFRD